MATKSDKIKLRPMWFPKLEMWGVAMSTTSGAGGWAKHSNVFYHTKPEAEKVIRGYVKDNPDVYAEG